ncbi:hypothetical protein QAD02_020488 [Eretmocerus hayati]|uniref:Uncharacterized protein n=1 Tax=Eretmocerus hayati TaxID=131215 RepID=A0ACC2PMN6_9HYME|nr:hypothetical protein QAD02_020488 [Eretmocerus hayati]
MADCSVSREQERRHPDLHHNGGMGSRNAEIQRNQPNRDLNCDEDSADESFQSSDMEQCDISSDEGESGWGDEDDAFSFEDANQPLYPGVTLTVMKHVPSILPPLI